VCSACVDACACGLAMSLTCYELGAPLCRPLHWAASLGHAAVADALLKAGADVNASNDEGLTPLHPAAGAVFAATRRGRLRVVTHSHRLGYTWLGG
jgi:hypothetical protein